VELTTHLESVRCVQCLERPPCFDRCCGLFAYQEPLINLIAQLKFGDKLYVSGLLGALLAAAVVNNWYKDGCLPQAVVPVPLHSKRLAKRGFNQVIEILAPVKKLAVCPILTNICNRVRFTKPQAKLSAIARQHNVSKAFALNKDINLEHIAIVDDVVTTGSTLNALSEVFLEHGVAQIDIWCICRA